VIVSARKCGLFWQEMTAPGVTKPVDKIREDPMSSVLMHPNRESQVFSYDNDPARGEDLGFIRHQLDALAYARAVCGLRPKDELEYRRLCKRELEILESVRRLVAR
jgi:hypothetical protein